MTDTQISAHISEATKEQVERYSAAYGVKKGALVEQALLHHLQALRELPADIILPPRMQLSKDSFARATDLVARPRIPTKAMRALMADQSDDTPDHP